MYTSSPDASWASPRIHLGVPHGRWGIRLHRGEYEDDDIKMEYYDLEDALEDV